VYAPHRAQGRAIVRLLEKKPGKNVRIQLDLGAIGKTFPRLQVAREKRRCFPPVGLKIGAQVDTGTASAAQSRLDDTVDEFEGSKILHGKTSEEISNSSASTAFEAATLDLNAS
jgi:hypothetical protein